jgi:hypothetical protein
MCDTWDNTAWQGLCWSATQEGENFVFKSTKGNLTARGKMIDGNAHNL